jgi:O-antigen/teichoic acid export membrane protein
MGAPETAVQIVTGFALIGVATWILLSPLFDAHTPGVGLVALAVASYVLGFLFVGRGSRAAISQGSTERPPAPSADQTMDWLGRH